MKKNNPHFAPIFFAAVLFVAAGAAFALFVPRALATTTLPATVEISPNLPGMPASATSSPGAFIAGFYQFSLMISGLLAFGVVVYGGVKYMTAAGNPSGQSEGKEWIQSALLGLLLLAGAYFILQLINPALLNLNLPNLSPVNVAGAPTSGTYIPTGVGCAGGNCSPLAADGFTCKPASQQPGGINSCFAAQGMVSTLDCIKNKAASAGFTVTEAMPPTNTAGHLSRCHSNGCCVDVVVNGGGCAAVQALVNAAAACGGSTANEYLSCGGTHYLTTDGDNLHINSAQGGGC